MTQGCCPSVFSGFHGDGRPQVTFVRDGGVWGLIKGKGYGHKGAVAHTQDQGHFEVRFAWGSFTKQESIQRLLPWAAPQGQKGKRTAEEKRDLGLVAQQLAESGSRSSEG